jgi:hypothetical protein
MTALLRTRLVAAARLGLDTELAAPSNDMATALNALGYRVTFNDVDEWLTSGNPRVDRAAKIIMGTKAFDFYSDRNALADALLFALGLTKRSNINGVDATNPGVSNLSLSTDHRAFTPAGLRSAVKMMGLAMTGSDPYEVHFGTVIAWGGPAQLILDAQFNGRPHASYRLSAIGESGTVVSQPFQETADSRNATRSLVARFAYRAKLDSDGIGLLSKFLANLFLN